MSEMEKVTNAVKAYHEAMSKPHKAANERLKRKVKALEQQLKTCRNDVLCEAIEAIHTREDYSSRTRDEFAEVVEELKDEQ